MDLSKIQSQNLVTRIIQWNSKRYTREYCPKLSKDLLAEEITELLEATNDVEYLDAIGDIAFVCIGALWKMGHNAKELSTILEITAEANTNMEIILETSVMAAFYTQGTIKATSTEELTEEEVSMGLRLETQLFVYNLLKLNLYHLKPLNKRLGFDMQLLDILEAIVKSNETKAVNKVASNMKANIVKGDNYVNPETDLLYILAQEQRRKND